MGLSVLTAFSRREDFIASILMYRLRCKVGVCQSQNKGGDFLGGPNFLTV